MRHKKQNEESIDWERTSKVYRGSGWVLIPFGHPIMEGLDVEVDKLFEHPRFEKLAFGGDLVGSNTVEHWKGKVNGFELVEDNWIVLKFKIDQESYTEEEDKVEVQLTTSTLRQVLNDWKE